VSDGPFFQYAIRSGDMVQEQRDRELEDYLAGLSAGGAGTPGPPGVGVPAGGATRDMLVKSSGANYDTEWRAFVELTVGTTPPSSPAIGDVWIDTS
jgi:hypothetical protein